MKNLTAYLHFPGNCREALNFYEHALGGELASLQTYEDAHMAKDASQKDWILHSEFRAGDIRFMASDGPPETITQGSHISLSIDIDDADAQTEIFNKLADGGIILMPLEVQFWEARFGMVRDKFGVNWMLSCPAP